MTVPEYRDLAQKAALRVGPSYLKTYALYAVFSAVLLYFSLQMQQRVMVWQDTVRQFILAGDPDLPPITTEVLSFFGLALILLLLSQVLRAGWFTITLQAVRGRPYSWRDLPCRFPQILKVFAMSLIVELGCIIGLSLLVFPGAYLFYRWRLCWFVLAEHPEYGPIRCLRQSARLMVGEKMNLFRLDLSLLLPYALAFAAYYFTYGVVCLWELPSISITHCVFYNRMVHWDEAEVGPPAEGA
jgi:uncharacterized membrane protein